VTVADFVLAYALNWANEAHMLDGFPQLQVYLAKVYARSHAPAAHCRGSRKHQLLSGYFELKLSRPSRILAVPELKAKVGYCPELRTHSLKEASGFRR
jgi:hypothetical protein